MSIIIAERERVILAAQDECDQPSGHFAQHSTAQHSTLVEEAVDIRSGQRLAWENKMAKGFNTTDVPLEFCLLQGEVAEAFDAWRKGREDGVGEELADVAIYLFGLAEMINIDLQGEVEAKITKNAARSYGPLPSGVQVKIDDRR